MYNIIQHSMYEHEYITKKQGNRKCWRIFSNKMSIAKIKT